MRRPQIESLSDSELCGRVDADVISRMLISSTNISVVERIEFDGGRTAILKTSVPELRHEAVVQRFARRTDIGAASVLTEDETAEFPWFLQEDIGENSSLDQISVEETGRLLESLAEFHAEAIASPDQLESVPDRSMNWMLENIDQVSATVHRALRMLDSRTGTEKSESEGHIDAKFRNGIAMIAESVSSIPITVVHGDFDPGNMAFTRGQWRAVDWGLAHRNIPFVDIAHMVMRFPNESQLSLVERYVGALSLRGFPLPPEPNLMDLVHKANRAHEAFFVWWHSYCIAELGVPARVYEPVLLRRYASIRAQGDEI